MSSTIQKMDTILASLSVVWQFFVWYANRDYTALEEVNVTGLLQFQNNKNSLIEHNV
jgi:hypothetical protein